MSATEWRAPSKEIAAHHVRLEISFSQGAAWKALMSTYIGIIPVSGDASGAAEQSISSGLPRTAVSSAMTAKVGAAASDRQSAAPRGPRLPRATLLVHAAHRCRHPVHTPQHDLAVGTAFGAVS
jgi:hypothetical protein